MNLYYLMAVIYIGAAILAAADSSLTNLNLLPWFNGLRWVRIHLITLGVMTQVIFGTLPQLVAIHYRRPRPAFRWDIWLSLNIGLILLLVGIPIINQALIYSGGTLVFIAASLLISQLWHMRPPQGSIKTRSMKHSGGRFYIAGLSFFLLGIIIGTGLWFNWSKWLFISIPLEAHIHANNWGLMSLVFAGLIVDTYTSWTGRSLAWPRSITPIFWLMTLGALALVLGPWFNSRWFTVPGLVMHQTATVWLLLNIIRPVWGDKPTLSRPGIWHVITSYLWISAPVMMAPLILLSVRGIPGPTIEGTAPQALIYGWVLQFGFALLPFFFRRAFLPDEPAQLGGNWLSLIAVNTGGLFLWISIFAEPQRALLQGITYALWTIAIVPIALNLWQIARQGLTRLDEMSIITAESMTD